jgi:hypothetical protein
MHASSLKSTRRARRILDAWEREDTPAFEAELRLAQHADAAPASGEEEERLDLLDGIAAQLEQELVGRQPGHTGSERVATCFRLLAHLATERPQAVNRSETLSCFRYSRSVLRISACH